MNNLFDNSFAHQLKGFYARCTPEPCSAPALVFFNHGLGRELGIDANDSTDDAWLASTFSGNTIPEGAQPIAQIYAGHQFGHFSPQLGDGRALILGEILDTQGARKDVCLKGSGRTPYSRNGDGRATLGSMLREVLISEAMYALGIPSTRSLAVVTTGDSVYRESLLPGAVLTRTADSHIRVGTFEFFAARQQPDKLQLLADYTITRHFPEVNGSDNKYHQFLKAVIQRQSRLIAQWMSVGFIHGVMNTDNMTIAGETIDYGPCAFMEGYAPDTVFSSIDLYGRYAYKNQPTIAQWNLSRFAETLLPLLHTDESSAINLANDALSHFSTMYQQHYLSLMKAKLGLDDKRNTQSKNVIALDSQLVEDLLALLHTHSVDYTLAFHQLSNVLGSRPEVWLSLFGRLPESEKNEVLDWQKRWFQRLEHCNAANDLNDIAKQIKAINPWIIPRNHRVEEAIEAAHAGNLSTFDKLLTAIQHPYNASTNVAIFAEPASAHFTKSYQTYCGT